LALLTYNVQIIGCLGTSGNFAVGFEKFFFIARARNLKVTTAQSVNSNELKGMGFCIRAAGFNRYNFPAKNSFPLDVWINKPKTERLDLNAPS